MSDDASTAARGVWELAALHPGILEGRNAVDCIEESKEADGLDWAAERFPESAHELQQLVLFRLFARLAVFVLVIWHSTLPLLKCS